MAAELYPSPARTQLDSELSLDDRTAAEILTSHTVEITKAVNLNNLRPYLIGNRCVTLSESRQQLKSASDTDTVIQFIEIVSKRGISAFRGFLKALEQYTTDEPSEGALIELLNKLRDDAASKLPTAPQNEPVIVVQQTPAETTIDLPEDPETESQDAPLSSNEQGQPNKDASAVTASVTRRIQIPGVSKFLINFLRLAGIGESSCTKSTTLHFIVRKKPAHYITLQMPFFTCSN
ncbi:hypothetical protein GBAR_LOCUS1301, partial [Geodia barretti]